jgi:hypothetical protein
VVVTPPTVLDWALKPSGPRVVVTPPVVEVLKVSPFDDRVVVMPPTVLLRVDVPSLSLQDVISPAVEQRVWV